MVFVQRILERKEVTAYLKKRNLLRQYEKAKGYLLSGDQAKVRFKERNPKGSGIYYFRVNKQFRAIGIINGNRSLLIYEINNHQN